MRQLRLLALAAFAIFAFGAVASAVASAEVDGPPKLLTLEPKITALEGKFTGEASELAALNKLTLTGTGVTATIKECLSLEGSETDTNLCHGTLTFTGVKQGGGVSCRSETLAKTKDPEGTVLTLVDLHLADEHELPSGEKLEPLLIAEVIAEDKDSELIINCGGVKDKIFGRIGCLLLPGLKEVLAGGNFEVLCKQTGGDQETGMCAETAKLCKELEEKPFLANLNGTPEMAGMSIHLLGSFNKDILIDD